MSTIITQVNTNNQPQTGGVPSIKRFQNITVSNGILTISGTTDAPDPNDVQHGQTVCCVLMRLGMKDKNEDNETIYTETRIVHKDSATPLANWQASFNSISHKAKYLVAAHSRTNIKDHTDVNDYAEVQVSKVEASPNVEIVIATSTSKAIEVQYTLINDSDPVSFALTQINVDPGMADDGQAASSTAPAVFVSGKQGGGQDTLVTKTQGVSSVSPPTLNSDGSFTVTFNGSFSGTYLVQVTAANEGTASVSVTIGT